MKFRNTLKHVEKILDYFRNNESFKIKEFRSNIVHYWSIETEEKAIAKILDRNGRYYFHLCSKDISISDLSIRKLKEIDVNEKGAVFFEFNNIKFVSSL